MDQPIVPFDLHRMFLGEEPPLFFLEIVFRCLVIYLWTLVLLRWIGGRSVTQLSLVEFLLVIALGSAVGDALFYPEVPLLHAMAVILTVVVFDKAIDFATLRWRGARTLIEGSPVELVRDGRILPTSIRRRTMGHAELEALLRTQGVDNLGVVEQAWMEANGRLSVLRRRHPQPGLPITPPHELKPPPEADLAETGARLSCLNCGLVVSRQALPPDLHCPECGHDRWTRAEPPG